MLRDLPVFAVACIGAVALAFAVLMSLSTVHVEVTAERGRSTMPPPIGPDVDALHQRAVAESQAPEVDAK